MNAYDSIIHENYTTSALVYTRVSHEEQVAFHPNCNFAQLCYNFYIPAPLRKHCKKQV